ncbi:MAG: hypothetical protein E7393_03610 [Ruminococcaceae bacterium]|nr:hypothetical protein [Oscillospiraceae bacterium]
MGLLENLQEKLRLEYLSDLSFLNDLSDLKEKVNVIPSDRYSLSEWTDAVNYITKSAKVFASSNDAKEYLLQF